VRVPGLDDYLDNYGEPGDRGEARITEAQYMTMRMPDMHAAIEALYREAHLRDIHVQIEDELPGRDLIVKWWPRGETR
jgi:hypothetical protein